MLLFAVSGTHVTRVSNQEPHSCLSTAPRYRTPPLTPRLVRQQMRYRGREQHEESSLLECEPMPPPGKGLRRRHRPLIGYVRTHYVRWTALNESHPPSTLFWFHVKPGITSIRYEFPCVHSSAVRGRHTEVSMAPRS